MEKQSAASGPVLGGKRMVLSGHNFLSDSKVIFVEKAPGISFKTSIESACCLGAGRGWLAGEGAMHGPRASHMASRGCGCGVCFCPASRCLFRGSNQLLLVLLFFRTADHPRQVSRCCAVGTEAHRDPTGPRDLSVPFAPWHSARSAERDTGCFQ